MRAKVYGQRKHREPGQHSVYRVIGYRHLRNVREGPAGGTFADFTFRGRTRTAQLRTVPMRDGSKIKHWVAVLGAENILEWEFN